MGSRGCGGSWRGRGIDISRACKEDVGLDVDKVRAPPPDILAVVNDGHHRVSTGEYRPGAGGKRWVTVTNLE